MIDSASVQLVVLKPADFGPGVVLRLWNAYSEAAQARLVFPETRRQSSLRRCDLLERPSGRASRLSPAGEVTVTLRPHEIATYLLHR